jgi:hypothetical protein
LELGLEERDDEEDDEEAEEDFDDDDDDDVEAVEDGSCSDCDQSDTFERELERVDVGVANGDSKSNWEWERWLKNGAAEDVVEWYALLDAKRSLTAFRNLTSTALVRPPPRRAARPPAGSPRALLPGVDRLDGSCDVAPTAPTRTGTDTGNDAVAGGNGLVSKSDANTDPVGGTVLAGSVPGNHGSSLEADDECRSSGNAAPANAKGNVVRSSTSKASWSMDASTASM